MSIAEKQRLKVYRRAAWSDGWIEMPSLACVSATVRVAPGVSTAEFRWKYGDNQQPGETAFTPEGPYDADGEFLQVRTSGSPETVVFTGIVDVGAQSPDGFSDGVERGDQVFSAFGLEHLLDRIQISGAQTKPTDAEDAATVAIDWTPAFNVHRKRGLALRGNRSHTTTDGAYAFAGSTEAATGAVWTHLDVVRYLFENHVGASPVAWSLNETDAFLALANLKTSSRLEGLSVRAALNRLIPRAWGFGWQVAVDGQTVSLEVFSGLDSQLSVGGVTFPANNASAAFSADTDARDTVTIRESSAERVDRIVVQGARVVTCFSLSAADGTLEAGWTAAQETAYKAGTGTPADDAALHDAARTVDKLAPVYARFRVPRAWDGRAGNGVGGGSMQYAFPSVSNTGVLNVNAEKRGARMDHEFSRHLPLQKGYDYSATPPAYSGPTDEDPEFEPMMAFILDTTFLDGNGDPAPRWLMADRAEAVLDELSRANAQVRPDDSDLAVWVRYNLQHALAKTHWSGAADSRVDPDGDGWGTDWEDLIVTVAAEVDARLRVVQDVEGVEQVQRTMVIEVPDAEMWALLPGTVVGVDVADGSLKRASAWKVLRDDSEGLRLIAALAERWFGHPRRAASIVSKDLTRYFAPGTMLTPILSGDLGSPMGVVTSVSWDGVALTATTQTEFMELDPVDLAKGLGFCDGYESGHDLARSLVRTEREVRELRAGASQVTARQVPPGPFEGDIEVDGICFLDPANPDDASGDVREVGGDARVTIAATGADAYTLYRDTATAKDVLLHFNRKAPAGSYLSFRLIMDVLWQAVIVDPATYPCDGNFVIRVDFDEVVDNFDVADDGSVDPPKNTFNGPPTYGTNHYGEWWGYSTIDHAGDTAMLFTGKTGAAIPASGTETTGDTSTGMILPVSGHGLRIRVREWRQYQNPPTDGYLKLQSANCLCTLIVGSTNAAAY